MFQTRHVRVPTLRVAGFAALLLTPLLSACELVDDVDSGAACGQFCSKEAACDGEEPTAEQTTTCVEACRSDIENNCGNDQQSFANEQILECVDLACDDFDTCMVFDQAPACFDFAHD
jgi:hypothetical protein